MINQHFDVKLPHIEGISAEVLIGNMPTIDELRQHDGRMIPLLIESGMPEPVVAVRLMAGVRSGEGPLLEVGFLANIDLIDTQKVEDSMGVLLLQDPGDGPPIESDRGYDTRLRIFKSDTSIIISSNTWIDPMDRRLPKKPVSAFSSKVFATAVRIIRNYDKTPTSHLDSRSIRNLGRFVIPAA